MEKYPFDVFSRYVDGNKAALTGIGVIATIAALFLNLDQSVFGDSLRNLQLLLLLFLILGLLFLTLNSFFWFKENADSRFASIIIVSLGLTIWRVWELVLDNFRDELNRYLLLILLSVTFAVYAFFNNIKKKAESDIDKKFAGSLSKALLYGLTAFLFFYIPYVILGLYSDFALGETLSVKKFLSPSYETFIWSMSVWVAIAEFCFSYFFIKGWSRPWLNIFLLTCLGISVLIFLWPIVLGLIEFLVRVIWI